VPCHRKRAGPLWVLPSASFFVVAGARARPSTGGRQAVRGQHTETSQCYDLTRFQPGQADSASAQVWSGTGSTLGDVRLTEFWDRMNAQFGEVYAQSVAKDFVFDKLGGRTVERALADGVDAKAVWRAVCDTFKVPENMR
jgi:hypothetical protein